MSTELQVFAGRNGVKVGDADTCWRAFGSVNVASPQILDYQSRDGRKTGIKYAIGFDDLTGRTRIAWVDYPKSMYELDDVLADEEVFHILNHCNVCNAMDQAGVYKSHRSAPPSPSVRSFPVASQPRVSVGDIVPSGANLPKYLTTGIKLGKSLGLRPAGDALFSLGLSFLSDLASGVVTDPKYKQALQSFSDDMVDSLTPEMISAVKEDAVRIAEAIDKDHTSLMSRKFIVQHMFKSPVDIKNELASSKSANEKSAFAPNPTWPQSQSSPHFNSDGMFRVPRIFE